MVTWQITLGEESQDKKTDFSKIQIGDEKLCYEICPVCQVVIDMHILGVSLCCIVPLISSVVVFPKTMMRKAVKKQTSGKSEDTGPYLYNSITKFSNASPTETVCTLCS